MEAYKDTVKLDLDIPKNLYDCIMNELLEDSDQDTIEEWIKETVKLQINAELYNKDDETVAKLKKYNIEEAS